MCPITSVHLFLLFEHDHITRAPSQCGWRHHVGSEQPFYDIFVLRLLSASRCANCLCADSLADIIGICKYCFFSHLLNRLPGEDHIDDESALRDLYPIASDNPNCGETGMGVRKVAIGMKYLYAILSSPIFDLRKLITSSQ